MTKEEWFNLPKLYWFDEDFNEKEFDEEMALGLLNDTQRYWCGRCNNYQKDSCGCYFPKFKEQMIFKIKRHFEILEEMKAAYNDLIQQAYKGNGDTKNG